MPKISRIQNDIQLSKDDKLLGSDVTGATRNYKLSDVANFCNLGGSYKHKQNNSSATWTITHNLDLENYLPNVSLKLSGGGIYNNVQALGVVTYINKNELTINFADPASGYAYVKK
tara:strand:+ start:1282 stop:1629 length:348 start_codon:yes stop_codon:yes gene_type:complete